LKQGRSLNEGLSPGFDWPLAPRQPPWVYQTRGGNCPSQPFATTKLPPLQPPRLRLPHPFRARAIVARRSREYPFAEHSSNDTQRRPTTSSFDALVSALGAKRHAVRMGPTSRFAICPPLARTTSSGLPKLSTSAETAMHRQPVRKHPLCATYNRRKGGIKSGAALPYLLTEVSLKAAPAASTLATEAHAPSPRGASLREQKENRPLLPYPLFQPI
jgi:hypothetical protein